ncbi:MAG TPA: rRNA adenine methyltransferase [Anaerolineae bacterium]|nr:rRNA adenine methyltransferase [Anaerolineae bacterium]
MDWHIDRRPMTADRRQSIWQINPGSLPSAVGGRLDDWEARWAPYDEPTYQAALNYLQPDNIVLDIGAGDLRLARRMAAAARRVYALEMQPDLLANQAPMPDNLIVLCADARVVPWPASITIGVLLMRHCTHVGLYVARLRAAGCRRLITNARWGMGVELMDLGPRLSWRSVDLGWYACTCGQTGFVPGPPEQLTTARMEFIAEVEECPACTPGMK